MCGDAKETMISIIITTYNRTADVLEKTLCSALNQTFKDIEVIIVNDSPNNKIIDNGIRLMLQKYNNFAITYTVNEVNSGSNYSRNYGAKLSKGEYLCFLDDDDLWKQDKLKYQIEKFNSEVGLVTGYYERADENGVVEIFKQPSFHKNASKNILSGNYLGSTSFAMVRRDVFFEVGGFDEGMPSGQEYDLWIRILQKYKYDIVESVIGTYIISSDSTFKSSKKNIAGYLKKLEKYENLYNKCKSPYNIQLNAVAKIYLLDKDYKNFLNYKLKAIKIKKISLSNFTIIHSIFNKIKKITNK